MTRPLISQYPSSDLIILVYLPMVEPGYIMADRTDYAMKRVPLLGLQYLKAVLQQEGYRVKLLDGSIEAIDLQRLIAIHDAEQCLFMGFYAHHYIRDLLKALLTDLTAARPDLTTVVGGPGFYDYARYLHANAAAVCLGEGERTIVELARVLARQADAATLRGVALVKDGAIVTTPPQPLIVDLDCLPFPDRSAYPIAYYHDYHVVGIRKPYTTMITSRGCPFHCTFCTTHDIWGTIRRRSVANVLAEIDEVVSRYGVRYIGFKDDLFGSHKLWVKDFVQGLKARNYDLHFNCMVSPRSFAWDVPGTLKALKQVGLDMIIPGMQSANPQILTRIGRKPSDAKNLLNLVTAAKRLDITTVVEFILGLPGETVATAKQDFDFALQVRPHYALFFSLVVLAGSQIHQEFGAAPVSAFSQQEIDRLVNRYSKGYFANPRTFIQFVRHVLRKNPKWFWYILPHALYLLRAIGLVRKRSL